MLHPLPCNRFYNWMPGLKWDNECNKVKLRGKVDIYTFRPKYNFTDEFHSDILNTASTSYGSGLLRVKFKKEDTVKFVLVTVINIFLLIFVFVIWQRRKIITNDGGYWGKKSD